MRQECKCQHNARNSAFDDKIGLFKNDQGEDLLYLEKNVQNAIELIVNKIREGGEIPDLSQYLKKEDIKDQEVSQNSLWSSEKITDKITYEMTHIGNLNIAGLYADYRNKTLNPIVPINMDDESFIDIETYLSNISGSDEQVFYAFYQEEE